MRDDNIGVLSTRRFPLAVCQTHRAKNSMDDSKERSPDRKRIYR